MTPKEVSKWLIEADEAIRRARWRRDNDFAGQPCYFGETDDGWRISVGKTPQPALWDYHGAAGKQAGVVLALSRLMAEQAFRLASEREES